MFEAARESGELDVRFLHQAILEGLMGLDEGAIRDQRNLRYVRGLEPAIEQVRSGATQAAFLLQPAAVSEVARIAFAGGVMPQKSTDFYPKLLSGLTIYRTG
jgi:uncharacterized protein (DUF1015 family)